MTAKEIGKGFLRKREKRSLGVFIDGTALDRATRRINRKVDMTALLRGVSSGATPTVARYYTIVPFEDDSRQRAYLDAVARAGFAVIIKRLPPKGITRQVTVDLEMAADMVAFAMGHTEFGKENEYLPANPEDQSIWRTDRDIQSDLAEPEIERENSKSSETPPSSVTKIPASVVVVCPSRELSYPFSLLKELEADTTSADFGQFKSGDILKSAAKWIDLSNSETIWRD